MLISTATAFSMLMIYCQPACQARRAANHTLLFLQVAGNCQAGKSTLVAVLTNGSEGMPALDNGRGAARMNVLRHKHEIETGHTSSISPQTLGYDAAGEVLRCWNLLSLHVATFVHG